MLTKTGDSRSCRLAVGGEVMCWPLQRRAEPEKVPGAAPRYSAHVHHLFLLQLELLLLKPLSHLLVVEL